MGLRGPQGPQGPQGLRGPEGPRGPQGIPGEPSPGTIIPFASGSPVELTTQSNGLPGRAGLIGFGNSATGPRINGNTIDLDNSNSPAINFAFSLPREAVVTSMSAFFNQLTGPDLDHGHLGIRAQLFAAQPETNLFTAIPRAEVILTSADDDDDERNDDANHNNNHRHNHNLSGLTTGLDIEVRAETRLLMVFLIETNGSSQCVTGYASAGLNLI